MVIIYSQTSLSPTEAFNAEALTVFQSETPKMEEFLVWGACLGAVSGATRLRTPGFYSTDPLLKTFQI